MHIKYFALAISMVSTAMAMPVDQIAYVHLKFRLSQNAKTNGTHDGSERDVVRAIAMRAIAKTLPLEKRHYLIGWKVNGGEEEFWSGDVAAVAEES